jgi:AcrR family transcriptional regulator
MYIVGNSVTRRMISVNSEKKFKYHEELREDTRALLRRNLTDAADHILTTEGPNALTVRRIAEELHASTKVIYSLFGGKDGLANELYLEGCDRLRHYIEGVVLADSVRDYVINCCWAYWNFAVENPSYYAVMFNNAIPQFKPKPESLANVATAFKILIEVLIQYQQDGKLSPRDPVEIIRVIWSPLHGVISLYVGQHFTEDEAKSLYSQVIEITVNWLMQT